MGNIKYGEFTFSNSKAKPAAKCYAKGGKAVAAKPVKREPEATVQKEVALLKKAGAPKALVEHEVREYKSPMALNKGGSAAKKLEKHANLPASKAHGPGAAAKLKKGGVPVHSKVPKIGKMK